MHKSLILFLIGAFSMTQLRIVGYIGVSELIMLGLAPYVFFRNAKLLRQHGFMPLLTLAALWGLSALATDLYRQNIFVNTIRGIAPPIAVMAGTICIHALLHDDLRRFKWLLVGFSVTVFLSTFILQPGSSSAGAAEQGISATKAVLGYKLTLLSMVSAIVVLPVQLAYLRIPFVSAILTVLLAIFALLQGGRSAFLCLLLAAGMQLLVGGQASRIRRVTRMALPLLAVLLAVSWGASKIYGYSAMHGYMGEDERVKYEEQAAKKIGVLSGRLDFMGSLLAIRDSPILGHGSWRPDYEGYMLKAMDMIDDREGAEMYLSSNAIGWIPGHSHIWGSWVANGIFGGVFWVFVLVLLWRFVFNDLAVFPAMYGYFSLLLPGFIWDILFSPFGNRQQKVAAIVLVLLVRNVHAMQKRQMAAAYSR